MWRRRELWPIVLISEVGNGLDPNETFGPRHRPETEPTEFDERTSRQRPISTDELVEKEPSQGQT